MKKRLIIISLIFILLFTIVSCKKPLRETSIINETFSAGNALETSKDSSYSNIASLTNNSTIVLYDNSEKKLTFNKIFENAENQKFNIYLDEKQNQYRFNQDNQLTSFTTSKKSTDVSTENPVSQNEANAIALQHMSNLYGDVLDGYLLHHCNDDGIKYDFQYVKKYGDNNFINGDNFLVSVYYDGTVRYSNAIHIGKFDTFNENLLDSVTFSSLQIYANQQAAKHYSDLVNCTLDETWLKKDNENYFLSLHVMIEHEQNGSMLVELQTYDYPLQ